MALGVPRRRLHGGESSLACASARFEAGEPCLGFPIRNVGRRVQTDARAGRELPRSVDQLTKLVAVGAATGRLVNAIIRQFRTRRFPTFPGTGRFPLA